MATEKRIETLLKENVEKLGGICYKFVSPGRVGVSDRLCALPHGIVFFVECKGTDGTLASKQVRELFRLRDLGHHVYTCRSFEELVPLILLMRMEIDHARGRS